MLQNAVKMTAASPIPGLFLEKEGRKRIKKVD
jgi:hypothetical protein